MTSFKDQWKDPRWQKRRLEAMERGKWQCENCGDKDTTLNVHHKRYIKGRSVWDYSLDLLAVLCESCHLEHHRNEQNIKEILSVASHPEVLALLSGYVYGEDGFDPGIIEEGRQVDPWSFAVGYIARLLAFFPLSRVQPLIETLLASAPEGSFARANYERDKEVVFDPKLG